MVKIYHKNNTIIKARNLSLINDRTISFNKASSQKKVQLSVDNVRNISVKEGSYALKYGIIGGGIGLMSSLIGIYSVEVNGAFSDPNINYAGIIIGMTVGCGAAGALIGALIVKWKRLYIHRDNSIYSFVIS